MKFINLDTFEAMIEYLYAGWKFSEITNSEPDDEGERPYYSVHLTPPEDDCSEDDYQVFDFEIYDEINEQGV